MFFPWPGLFEQVSLADIFVYYDDVQFSKGSFANRVQIKTERGPAWLTVPVRHQSLSQTIARTIIDDTKDWRTGHLAILGKQFADTKYCDEVLALVRTVYEMNFKTLADLTIASMNAVLTYFELSEPRNFVRSSNLDIAGRGSQRVLEIVRRYGGTRYITGHGAKNYLDHEAFEKAGIRVEYMDYARRPYPQLFGEFTASVSVLDLIANMGRAGVGSLQPRTVYWRDFVNG